MTRSGNHLAAGEYWFEDLAECDHYETGHLVVTDAHIVAFAGLSGDFFDLHMDDEIAKALGFPARVAHGLLGLALIDGLKNRSAVRIMAVASLGWNWHFRAPIFAGDRIGANIRVASTRLSSKGQAIVTLAFKVTKQDGTTVQDGETALLVRQRTPN
ncbi:MaoC family dehydratase [Bradyrhizobium genomosp. I (2014)]|uniref:MaoC family dehydratase n=1 Tax=Bradyrhizobium genomosp. I (2014) TaxID=2683269 RepID=UPI0004BAD2EC|nr:MaoC/PaaZ C-terminal domain-containing protein [Bradyrhizobium sp. CCBAU 43298]